MNGQWMSICKTRLLPIGRPISVRRIVLVVIDQLFCLFSLWSALNLANAVPLSLYPVIISKTWMLFSLTYLVIATLLGFYSHVWRYASLNQYFTLVLGVMVQTALVWGFSAILDRALLHDVYAVYFMVFFILIVGIRVLYRVAMRSPVLRAIASLRRMPPDAKQPACRQKRKRLIIIGAGPFGSELIREMQLYSDEYEPVAIIDDDPKLRKFRVMGVPVHGGRETIPEAVCKYKADSIILGDPNAPRALMRDLFKICNQTGCELKTMPKLSDVIDGKLILKKLKSVEIDDLLGRDEIVLDTQSISDYLTGETVLVTGGGGSIGSEICRQIMEFKPKQLIIFDIYENNAYQLKYELKGLYGDDLNVVIQIGSVRDRQRLRKVFTTFKPGVVFHAAAHKHVPLMEDSPGEAVKNNIIGTYYAADEAARAGVKRFVLISTDKAVNPTSVMGASKRFAEMVVQTLSRDYPQTRFAAVRFGNVLGSNGSIIPLFKQQIINEHRVTVTHPNMTRFFMTIPEAARLVIQAGALAAGGEIFVLDMGEPVKIDDLARVLIRLSGLEPEVDVQIVYTGLRPGEKMYEELFQDMENMTKSRHEMIYVLKPIIDQEKIEREIGSLQNLIRWENPFYTELVEWLKEKYHMQQLSSMQMMHASASAPAPAFETDLQANYLMEDEPLAAASIRAAIPIHAAKRMQTEHQ